MTPEIHIYPSDPEKYLGREIRVKTGLCWKQEMEELGAHTIVLETTETKGKGFSRARE